MLQYQRQRRKDPQLPRIANFDDLDPLAAEPDVDLRLISRGNPIPADADVIILVGSKATIDDLADLRREGWDIDIAAHIRRGGHVLGLCGGYQMLGQKISDPNGIEGAPRTVDGLGHLEVDTVLGEIKELALRRGTHIQSGTDVNGYEIHMGQTSGPDQTRGWLDMGDGPSGAMSTNGRISGTYLHGIFSSDDFRRAFLASFGTTSNLAYDAMLEQTLDDLADHLEKYLDVDLIWKLAGEISPV